MKLGSLPMFFASLLLAGCVSEAEVSTLPAPPQEGETRSSYDEALATRLGANEHGMKKFVLAFLKAGPNRDQDSLATEELQRAHIANIERLAAEGKLVVAGPFLDDGELRGIFIFDVESVEEARALTETDPAVQAGRLTMELHPWLGSAALLTVNEVHGKLIK